MVWSFGYGPVHTVCCRQDSATLLGDKSFCFTLANIPRALANANETSLRVFSTGDLPDVYEDSFLAVAKPDGTTFVPTLILIGTRLGIDKINQVYQQALIATLQMPQSIGIAGYAFLSASLSLSLSSLWKTATYACE